MLTAARNDNKNFNILLRAPSGCGKTKLSFIMASFIGWNMSQYHLCYNDTINPEFSEEKRVHIIDEIHLLTEPEFLYPLLDSNKYLFILLTNESGSLKEPLINRCIHYIFSPYSIDEIEQIVGSVLKYLDSNFIKIIASRCRNNPRIALTIVKRLDTIIKIKGIPTNEDELINILDNVLNIFSNGLTQNDYTYLNALEKITTGSLDTLCYLTRIDRDTVRRDIEPYLLYLGLIKITSRGRTIVNDNTNN